MTAAALAALVPLALFVVKAKETARRNVDGTVAAATPTTAALFESSLSAALSFALPVPVSITVTTANVFGGVA